jgi:hypothetical protein
MEETRPPVFALERRIQVEQTVANTAARTYGQQYGFSWKRTTFAILFAKKRGKKLWKPANTTCMCGESGTSSMCGNLGTTPSVTNARKNPRGIWPANVFTK